MTVTEQLSALDSILAHGDLHCLFQPILSLSERRLVGYEALTRGPSNSPLHSPLALFAVARQCGTAERTGTTLPTTRLQPLPRHPGRRHAVPQRLPGVPP